MIDKTDILNTATISGTGATLILWFDQHGLAALFGLAGLLLQAYWNYKRDRREQEKHENDINKKN